MSVVRVILNEISLDGMSKWKGISAGSASLRDIRFSRVPH